MVAARPFRSQDRTALLDNTPLGAPEAERGNPLLEETGFTRLKLVEPGQVPHSGNRGLRRPTEEAISEQEVARFSSAGVPVLDVPELLAALVRDGREREPAEGDLPLFKAAKVTVANGVEAAVVTVTVAAGEVAYVVAVGCDAEDGVDQTSIEVDGVLLQRSLFVPGTVDQARVGRTQALPLKATRKVEVKVKNNGGVGKDIRALVRGWRRVRTQSDSTANPGL